MENSKDSVSPHRKRPQDCMYEEELRKGLVHGEKSSSKKRKRSITSASFEKCNNFLNSSINHRLNCVNDNVEACSNCWQFLCNYERACSMAESCANCADSCKRYRLLSKIAIPKKKLSRLQKLTLKWTHFRRNLKSRNENKTPNIKISLNNLHHTYIFYLSKLNLKEINYPFLSFYFFYKKILKSLDSNQSFIYQEDLTLVALYLHFKINSVSVSIIDFAEDSSKSTNNFKEILEIVSSYYIFHRFLSDKSAEERSRILFMEKQFDYFNSNLQHSLTKLDKINFISGYLGVYKSLQFSIRKRLIERYKFKETFEYIASIDKFDLSESSKFVEDRKQLNKRDKIKHFLKKINSRFKKSDYKYSEIFKTIDKLAKDCSSSIVFYQFLRKRGIKIPLLQFVENSAISRMELRKWKVSDNLYSSEKYSNYFDLLIRSFDKCNTHFGLLLDGSDRVQCITSFSKSLPLLNTTIPTKISKYSKFPMMNPTKVALFLYNYFYEKGFNLSKKYFADLASISTESFKSQYQNLYFRLKKDTIPKTKKRILGINSLLFRKKSEEEVKTSMRKVLSFHQQKKHVKSVSFIIVFLIIMPLFFVINSIENIDIPSFTFAPLGPNDPLNGDLQYQDDLGNLGITFNGKYATKGLINLSPGQKGIIKVTLTPNDVPDVEGKYLKEKYTLLVQDIYGPKEDFELLMKVDLSEFDLTPGIYDISYEYYVTEGLIPSTKGMLVENYEVVLTRDNLDIVPANIFDFGYDLILDKDVVFTIDREDSFDIIFNGTIVNSLNEGVSIDDLSLYIEFDNKFEKVYLGSTSEDGHFTYTHTVYGSLPQSTLTRITVGQSIFYNKLTYEEYAAFQSETSKGLFFAGLDDYGNIEWPFDLYDLLEALKGASVPLPPSLAFYAPFDEGTGTSTYDNVSAIEGILKGNPAWEEGKIDYALSFNIGETGPLSEAEIDYVDFGSRTMGEIFGKENNEWTIGMWVNPADLHPEVNIRGVSNSFLCRGGDDCNVELGISPEGELQVYLATRYSGTPDEKEILATYGTSGAISTNEWTFIAIIYNQGDVDVLIGNEYQNIWYFEANDGTDPWLEAISLQQSNGPFTIATGKDIFNYFSGLTDELYIFREAISYSDVEKLKYQLEITATVSKEIDGEWFPTSSGEILDDYINFECSKTPNEYVSIETLEFYLSNSVPDTESPDPSWSLIATLTGDREYSSFIMNSRDIPDDSWYFIVKATDNYDNIAYDVYDISEEYIFFNIEHFLSSVSFNYLDIVGKISKFSDIEIIPLQDFAPFLDSLDIYGVYNDVSYNLNSDSIPYSEIASSYNRLDLSSLNLIDNWISTLPIGEPSVSFTVTVNLDFGSEFQSYLHDYSLPLITFDNLDPDVTPTYQTLIPGTVYTDINEYLLTARIDSVDMEYLKFDYKYSEAGLSSDWINYADYSLSGVDYVDIIFNILPLKDGEISIRFTATDNLGNSYEIPVFSITKDFDNHQNFIIEGLNDNLLYSLNFDNKIDIDMDIFPFDNDVTAVIVNTSLESFSFAKVADGDHFYFFDDDSITDILELDPSLYGVFGSEFTEIPLSIELFQDLKKVTARQIIISATDTVFSEVVTISDVSVDINTLPQTNNILMSFLTGTDTYKNADEIPFRASSPPIVNILNSHDDIVDTVELRANYDSTSLEIYGTIPVDIINNQFYLSYLPTLIPPEEICSIEDIIINSISYDFNYFIDSNGISIRLRTEDNLDGTYDIGNPINLVYGISTSSRAEGFIGSYNFQALPQDGYTIIGEFVDISSAISLYEIPAPIGIDFFGPSIFNQFPLTPIPSINPLGGSLSFIIQDYSGIDILATSFSYSGGEFGGTWSSTGDLYSFTFDDTIIETGAPIDCSLVVQDTLGLTSNINFQILIDSTPPVFLDIINDLDYFRGLYTIQVRIGDISDYDLAFRCISGVIYDDLDVTIVEDSDNWWKFTVDTHQLPNGKFDVSILATDSAGNTAEAIEVDRYFDNSAPVITSLTKSSTISEGNSFLKDIVDLVHFNNDEVITFQGYDELFDGFFWNDPGMTNPSQELFDQQGIDSVDLYLTNPISIYDIKVDGGLNYDTLIYEITEYGQDPTYYTTVSRIIDIQSLIIDGIEITDFTVLSVGTTVRIQIDEQYRFLLSPDNSIQARFYELKLATIPLIFDRGSWELLPGSLTYLDGDQFLFWFSVKDGIKRGSILGNELVTERFTGIYDITPPSGIFSWPFGLTSSNEGVLIFGTEVLEDSTISLNIPSSDIDRVLLYESEDSGSNYVYLGRAYSLSEDIWNYYISGTTLSTIPNLNYIKIVIIDHSGNTFRLENPLMVYSYDTIEMISDLVMGELLEFDPLGGPNQFSLGGAIQDISELDLANPLGIISEYYNPNSLRWIELGATSETIQLDGTYSITWDVDNDVDFTNIMYDLEYDCLPLQIAPETGNDIFASWGKFYVGSEWQPVIITEDTTNSQVLINIYSFDDINGWNTELSFATPSWGFETFKVFDIDGNGDDEIIIVDYDSSDYHVDVINVNPDLSWNLENNLQSTELFSFDLFTDISTSETFLYTIQGQSGVLSFGKYMFDASFNLISLASEPSPANFEPTAIRIVEDIPLTSGHSLLIGGLVDGKYYSQVFHYDSNLNLINVIGGPILGEVFILEFGRFNNIDTVVMGLDRLQIGKMDAVVTFRYDISSQSWIEFEISNFDEVRLEIMDILLIDKNNFQKLVLASETGVYSTSVDFISDTSTIESPVCYTASTFSKVSLIPLGQGEYRVELIGEDIESIKEVSYKQISTGDWITLDPTDYSKMVKSAHLALDITDMEDLNSLKVSYSFYSLENFEQDTIEPSYNTLKSSESHDVSASASYFANSRLPLVWLNPTSSTTDVFVDWRSFSTIDRDDESITYRNIPAVSNIGGTLSPPTIVSGWQGNTWGTEYTNMPELDNSLISHTSGEYDSGELSQYLSGTDDYNNYPSGATYDGQFEGNYVDKVYMSNPAVSDNFNFEEMYEESIHDEVNGDLYKTSGDPDDQSILVRNEITEFNVKSDVINGGIIQSGDFSQTLITLPSSGPPPPALNMPTELAYWDFEEGSGNIA
jgi:hypothetical protein